MYIEADEETINCIVVLMLRLGVRLEYTVYIHCVWWKN